MADRQVARKPGETHVCGNAHLPEGGSYKFVLNQKDRPLPCFAIRYRGRPYAYVNACRHVASTLDWVDNQFFSEQGDYILCPAHGAWYRPETGECVEGPPCGKSLYRVPLVERDGELFALSPEWT